MIVTVTPNPAMDQICVTKDFRPGRWSCATEASRVPGGKGVNVSIILKQLGFESVAMGFLAGHAGAFVRDELLKRDISTNFVNIKGESRTTTFIQDADEDFEGVETAITDDGPYVGEDACRRFFWMLDRLLPRATALHLGGSLPPGVPDDFFREATDAARRRNIPVFVDSYGDVMDRAIEALPTMVKIDSRALHTMRAISQSALDHLIESSKNIFDEGVDWVVSSYFNRSNVFCTTKGLFMGEFDPEGMCTYRSADDALLAGMIAAREERMGIEETIRFAMACVIANVRWPGKGIPDRETVEKMVGEVVVTKL